jgi:hypothetical protein
MKKFLLFLFVFVGIMSACAPSQSTVQTAIANTQAAWTPTPSPIPTATINPCSDRGWADIVTYLKQYDQLQNSMQVGTSEAAFIAQLNNMEEKINSVSVDACTEHARQTVIGGLQNQTLAFQMIFIDANNTDYLKVLASGLIMIKDAEKELKNLGLQIDLISK